MGHEPGRPNASALAAAERTIPVDVRGLGTVTVTYDLARVSVEVLEALAPHLALSQVLVRWDLMVDDEHPAGTTTKELAALPLLVVMTIGKAIADDAMRATGVVPIVPGVH